MQGFKIEVVVGHESKIQEKYGANRLDRKQKRPLIRSRKIDDKKKSHCVQWDFLII